jgi:hypothetical protein
MSSPSRDEQEQEEGTLMRNNGTIRASSAEIQQNLKSILEKHPKDAESTSSLTYHLSCILTAYDPLPDSIEKVLKKHKWNGKQFTGPFRIGSLYNDLYNIKHQTETWREKISSTLQHKRNVETHLINDIKSDLVGSDVPKCQQDVPKCQQDLIDLNKVDLTEEKLLPELLNNTYILTLRLLQSIGENGKNGDDLLWISSHDRNGEKLVQHTSQWSDDSWYIFEVPMEDLARSRWFSPVGKQPKWVSAGAWLRENSYDGKEYHCLLDNDIPTIRTRVRNHQSYTHWDGKKREDAMGNNVLNKETVEKNGKDGKEKDQGQMRVVKRWKDFKIRTFKTVTADFPGGGFCCYSYEPDEPVLIHDFADLFNVVRVEYAPENVVLDEKYGCWRKRCTREVRELDVPNTTVISPDTKEGEDRYIDPISKEKIIRCWDVALRFIFLLQHAHMDKNLYIYIDDIWDTVEFEFGSIFNKKFISLWFDDFGHDKIGETRSSDVITCRMMLFKEQTFTNDADVEYESDEKTFKNILKKLRKFL